MSTIDKKIVEMEFNNKNFESNADVSISTLDRLKKAFDFTKVGHSFDSISGYAKGVDLGSIGSDVKSISDRFTSLGVVATAVLANIAVSAFNSGKNLISSLTIDPVLQGYNEYELKMNSIQTIMASTGEPLAVVTEKLEELNQYADRTIYSFSDMTTNIGKFTNAGVSLEDAVGAIQGISNAAALSGSNAQQASHAMYNFAQALAAGHVKLIDWKSIEIAGMATEKFKEQLLEGAVAAGTMARAGDGMYQVLSTNSKGDTMGSLINSTTDFTSSLQYQWMTSETLIDTLNRYSDTTTELGQQASEAAQSVKTFSQFIGVMQESVGSGWSSTFEILIGDFEEAKSLWRDISVYFGGMLNASADIRNELLKGWKDLGGRDSLVTGLWNLVHALEAFVSPIKEAFRDLFPPQTAQGLVTITKGFESFTLMVADFANRIHGPVYAAFKVLFTILKAATEAVKFFISILKTVAGIFAPIVESLIGMIGTFANFMQTVFDTADSLIDFQGIFVWMNAKVQGAADQMDDSFLAMKTSIQGWVQANIMAGRTTDEQLAYMKELFQDFKVNVTRIYDDIAAKTSVIWEGLKLAYEKIRPLVEAIKNAVKQMWDSISKVLNDMFEGFNGLDTANLLNVGIIATIGYAIKHFIQSLDDPITSLAGFADSIKGLLNAVKESFVAWQNALKAKILKEIAIAIAILAASLFVLATIDSPKLLTSLGAIMALFLGLFVFMQALSKVMEKDGSQTMAKMALALMGVSAALLLMAFALRTVASLDPEQTIVGLGAMAAMIYGLVYVSKTLKSEVKDLVAVSAALVVFAAAINIMGRTVKALGGMEYETLIKGLMALALLVVELLITTKLLKADASTVAAIANLKELAAAILVLTSAVFLLGSMNIGVLLQGLSALSLVLAIFVKAIQTLPKDLAAKTTGMVAMAGALVILAAAVWMFGRMNLLTLAQGMIAIAAALGILVGASILLKNSAASATAMIAMAVAVGLLVPSIIMLGQLTPDSLRMGLASLAGILLVLAIASMALAPAAPGLLMFAGSLAVVSAAIALMGFGIQLLGVGLVSLGLGATAAVAGIVAVAMGLVKALAVFFKGIGTIANVIMDALLAIMVGFAETIIKFIVNLLVIIVEYTPAIVGALMDFINAALLAIAKRLPEFMIIAGIIIVEFIKGLRTFLPEAMEEFLWLLLELLTVFTLVMPSVVVQGMEFITRLLEGILTKLPEFVIMIMLFVTTFLFTLASMIPDIIVAGVAIVLSLIIGLAEGIILIVEVAIQILISFVAALIMQIPVLVDAAFKIIIDFINGLSDAIEDNTDGLIAAGTRLVSVLITSAIKAAVASVVNLWNLGKDLVGEVVAAVKEKLPDIVTKGKEMISKIWEGIKQGVKDFVEGIKTSIKSVVADVVEAVKSKGSELWTAGKGIVGDIVDGAWAGIKSFGSSLIEGGKNIGSNILGGIKSFLGINSPSKEAEKVGIWTGEGAIIGISSMHGQVFDSGENLGSAMLDGLSNTMGHVTDILENDNTYRPVVKPILDTADMDSSLVQSNSKFASMFDAVAVSSASAVTIKPVKPGLGSDGSGAIALGEYGAKEAQPVTFVQNINSPTALSTSDVYRHTSNQLAKMKGRLA